MKRRLLPTALLIVYSSVLIKVMVLKDLPAIRIGAMIFKFGGTHDGPPNLIPFRTILPYLLGEKGLLIAAVNIGGNILLLVPLGLLIPFVFRNLTCRRALAMALAAGFVIEGMQEILRVGIFDIDDILLNALGVMIGYWMFIFFAKRLRLIKTKYIITAVVVIVVLAVTASFYAIRVLQQRPVATQFKTRVTSNLPDSVETTKDSIPRGSDPCKGTGGTGQIVTVSKNSITIQLHNGRNMVINFTDQTMIRNAAGVLSRSALKVGDRVTVVVDIDHGGGKTASTVLVCNDAAGPVK